MNPANAINKPAAERKRIPMSVPQRKLEAPEIPGYVCYWMLGTPSRLQQAERAGYEFVDEKEVMINSTTLGNAADISGSTDMGSRVSIGAGEQVGTDGQPVRLYLMKIRKDWYAESQAIAEQRNDSIADALRGGKLGSEKDARGDTAMRYIDPSRTKIPDLFTPKRNKGA